MDPRAFHRGRVSLVLLFVLAGCTSARSSGRSGEHTGVPFRTVVAAEGDDVFLAALQLAARGGRTASDAALVLLPLIPEVSQLLARCAAPELIGLGFSTADPLVLRLGCELASSVTAPALRGGVELDAAQRACAFLRDELLESTPCPESAALLRTAAAKLLRGEDDEARRLAARGFLEQARCRRGRALAPVPAEAGSPAFLLMAALQLSDPGVPVYSSHRTQLADIVEAIASRYRGLAANQHAPPRSPR